MWFINDYDGSMLRWYYKEFWGIDIGEEPSNKNRGEETYIPGQ